MLKDVDVAVDEKCWRFSGFINCNLILEAMPLKIESYSFGKITISGKRYNSDVIIYPDKVDDSWWRKEGHSLYPEDIKEVIEEKPEVIVVGTGAYGVMKVSAKTIDYVQSRGIELKINKTRKACDEYNSIKDSQKTIACLHLTC